MASGDWFDGGGSGALVDVSQVLSAGPLDAVVGIVGAGALVSFGLSRDGGALAVTVTVDGRWRREWFREGDDLDAWLEGARRAVDALVGSPPPAGQGSNNGASKPPRRRQKTL